MRMINAFVTAGIMILFVLHLFWGVFIMLGAVSGGSTLFSFISYLMTALVAVHLMIGCKLTYDTVKAVRRSEASYTSRNRLFWIRRISGFATAIFMAVHVWLFQGINEDGAFRLHHFDTLALVTQLLMVLSLAVHILTNIRPLKIALGIEDTRNFRTDILIMLSAALLLSAIGFVLYLIRWRTL